MRTKAENLEKGKWYADQEVEGFGTTTFLKFKERNSDGVDFTEKKGFDPYLFLLDGVTIGFPPMEDNEFFIPTPEDIEKYGLIDDETT